MYLELHIREFEYRNIKKYQNRKQLIAWALCLLLGTLTLNCILYGFYKVIFVTPILIIGLLGVIKRKKKKTLGYDLVVIDEKNRFFYNNMFIEMADLENYVVLKENVQLNFVDYCLVVENDVKLYDYLNQFTSKQNVTNYKKTVFFSYCLTVLYLFFSFSLENLILGGIYAFLNQVEMISISTILVPVIQMISIILGIALTFFVANKFKKGIGFYVTLILVVLYIGLPFIVTNKEHALTNTIVYIRQNQSIKIYSQCKNGYGKPFKQTIKVNADTKIDVYKDIVYVFDKQKIKAFSLENERNNKNILLKLKNQIYVGYGISTKYEFKMEKEKAFLSKNGVIQEVDFQQADAHTAYFKYLQNYYLLYLTSKDELYLYDIKKKEVYTMVVKENDTENTEVIDQSQNQTESNTKTQEDSSLQDNEYHKDESSLSKGLENDLERVYFEKVYELLKSQNKLDNPCFDYQYDAKGYPYAVVNTQGNRIKSLVFNKQSGDDYEIVLEEYNQNEGKASATLIDFYLVNTKSLEVTDEQKNTW